MNFKSLRKVAESYDVIYTNPIKLKTGERVSIEKWETNPEWAGWAFCVDQRGIKGWVSEKYLRVEGNSALVLREYDATELAVEAGESVRLQYEEFGWAWVENKKGNQGWVPLKNLIRSLTEKFVIRDGYEAGWIDDIIALHNKTEMKRNNAEQVGSAFSSSFAVATAWIGNNLIGCGRMISDGEMYSGIFDVVVDPEFQKQGIGRGIMEHLISKAPKTCIHLTSTFGNENFYGKLGFKKHKTAMALYPSSMAQSSYLDHARESVKQMNQPKLETTRLILESYQDCDLEDVFAYACNPEVTKRLTWEPHKSLEDSKSFLQWVRASTRNDLGNLFFVFAIRLKETGRVIGSIDFKNPQPWVGQIDYVIGYEHWGKGLMPEAATALRDWSLKTLPEMVRLQAYCEPENKGSARVMEKIGMKFEGIRQKSFRVRERIVDLAHYALIRDEI
jgi:ribosomal-protein-alanine N-acetyltransferase